MARIWPLIPRVGRWIALLSVLAGALMFVVGTLTASPILAANGYGLTVGVSLLLGVVYCGVFAADQSRERRAGGHSSRT